MSFSGERILVIGLGLIGGSFARAARQLEGVEEVVGFDLNREECELACSLGVVDRIASDLETEVRAASLVMLAVPVRATETVLETLAPWVTRETLVSDVGSTKSNLADAARRIWTEVPGGLVPGHPIAGAERSGVAASDAELFRHRKVILTPLESSDPQAVMTLARIWQRLGSEVLQMDVQRHDEVLAATSHLPHLLAFSLVDTLASERDSTEIFRYAAGGFRDFTRIAASDPTMWHDVCSANKKSILDQIDRFSAGVETLRTAIEREDSQSLMGIFTRAKHAREHFSRLLERTGYTQTVTDANERVRVSESGSSLHGHVRVPGDRSIAHRSLIFAALAEGKVEIEGVSESEDTLATIQAFRDLGVVIEGPYQGRVSVYGVGLKGLQKPSAPLYFGHSLSALRMLLGVLVAQPFDTEVHASDQIGQQDLVRLLDALRQMGAQIEDTSGSTPLKVKGGQSLRPHTYAPERSSAQVKTALILAAICSGNALEVVEASATRDHTERMLERFGVPVQRSGRHLRLGNVTQLIVPRVEVPADLSLASGFMLAGTVIKNSTLVIEHTGVNPTRQQLMQLLQLMGAQIELKRTGDCAGEPKADLQVSSSELTGIEFGYEQLAPLSEELPILMAAMACAEGSSAMSELDRLPQSVQRLIALTAEQLQRLGVPIERRQHAICIEGKHLKSGSFSVESDQHPMLCLALIVLGSFGGRELTIQSAGGLTRVFPEFVDQCRRVGLKIFKE